MFDFTKFDELSIELSTWDSAAKFIIASTSFESSSTVLGFEMPIPVYGNGLQVRDWIYVEDHCSALEQTIKKGAYGETYLVSANNERHNIDVIKSILKELNKSEKLINFVKDRPGHDVRYAIDARKITVELGWKPKIKFDDGLKLTMSHYLKNLDYYSKKALA